MRRFLTDLKPTCFEDVISAVSLFRPGPLDAIEDGKTMVQHFVDRKHGREKVEYDHPLLEPVLKDTYGVIVYQEHVMRAAQAIAGYSLQQADILRAAMGKKNKAAMEKEREGFIEGAVKNGLSQGSGGGDFLQDRNFRGVRIPARARRRLRADQLSHRVSARALSARVHGGADLAGHGRQSKTYKNIAALREMKIGVLPPDINQSRVKFAVVGRGDSLRPGARFAASARRPPRRLSPSASENGPSRT